VTGHRATVLAGGGGMARRVLGHPDADDGWSETLSGVR